jgi:endonuclease/exonuclease/phosphatase family metal-dependent hydrolase
VSRAARIFAVALAALVGLLAVQPLFEAASGSLALLQVIAPHLGLLAVLAAAGLALATRHGGGIVILAAAIFVVAVRFGDEWVSFPEAAPDGQRLAVMTWNLEVGARTAPEVVDTILARQRDVVALQELTPAAAAFLESDPRIKQQYPYRVLVPEATVRGLGILSAYSIAVHEHRPRSAGLWANLDVGGRAVNVLVAHPMPGTIQTGLRRIPVGFDGRARDQRLIGLRGWLAGLTTSTDARVVLLGDLNVAPTEPGYDIIARGWVDAHRAVGLGTGWTWRPSPLEFLGAGLLRIDYVLSHGPIEPISTATICHAGSDHCALDVTLRLTE